MRRGLATVALVATALVPTAAAAPPGAGVLVPGRSLGGIGLGSTKAEVERRWGRAYGVCRGCTHETWYFNYYAFQPRGAGIEWRQGRVAAVFTLYQPLGWRTTKGVKLGDLVTRVTGVYGPLATRSCGGYTAHVLPERTATTVFYVLSNRLWAFGLVRPGIAPCR